jgi:hypothetical protein
MVGIANTAITSFFKSAFLLIHQPTRVASHLSCTRNNNYKHRRPDVMRFNVY